MFHTSYVDTDYFDIVVGVLPCRFTISHEYALRIAIEEKKRRLYLAETITDAGYACDIVPLANTHAQSESLRHSLKQATGSIGVHVNANKTDFMCFKRKVDISTFSGRPLELVDKNAYLGSNI